jgi:hypothetical protein
VVAGVEFDSLAELLTVRLSAMRRLKQVIGSDLRSGLEVLCGKQLVAFSLECVGHDYTVMCKRCMYELLAGRRGHETCIFLVELYRTL